MSGERHSVVAAATTCSLDLCGSLLSAFSLSEQFRYKRRVYAQNLIDDKQFSKLHTKVKAQSLEGTPPPHDPCSCSGLAQPAFPEVAFGTWSGAGYRLRAHDWFSDRFRLNQIFAVFEAGGEGSK